MYVMCFDFTVVKILLAPIRLLSFVAQLLPEEGQTAYKVIATHFPSDSVIIKANFNSNRVDIKMR